jgi:hypothetical protein
MHMTTFARGKGKFMLTEYETSERDRATPCC